MRNCLRAPIPAKTVFKEFEDGQWHLIYRVHPATGRKLLEDFNRVFNDAWLTVKPRWEDHEDCVRLVTYKNPARGRAALMFNYRNEIAVVHLVLDLNDEELPDLMCRDWRVYHGTQNGRRIAGDAPTPWGVTQHEQVAFPTVPEERRDVRVEYQRSVWGIFVHYLKGLLK